MKQRIRFGKPFELSLPEEMLPPHDLIIPDSGTHQRRSENFQIYIVDHVFGNIWNHLESNPQVEAGGLLVGHPFKCLDDPDTTFVVITGAIRQDSDNRSVGHFTVGPHDIAAAREKLEEAYPGLVVVGWYHSHPGHGVFLSGQDMQIVGSIYNADWHVALVVDPQQGRAGKAAFFHGPAGQRLSGWIELKKIPIFVTAMELYNELQEMLAQVQMEAARDLLIKLERFESDPDLIHWHKRGGYRDIKAISDQLSTVEINSDETHSLALTSPLAAEEPAREEDIPDEVIGYYRSAKTLVERAIRHEPPDLARLKEARQIFNRIHQQVPGYKGVDLANELINQMIEIHSQQRSISSAATPIKNLLITLSEWLQGRGQPTQKPPRRRNPDPYTSDYEERTRPPTKTRRSND
jgi:proteasome lid subunit RPN8/RPN11